MRHILSDTLSVKDCFEFLSVDVGLEQEQHVTLTVSDAVKLLVFLAQWAGRCAEQVNE
jgi:hypothetical protein